MPRSLLIGQRRGFPSANGFCRVAASTESGAAATDTDGDDVLDLPDVDGDGTPDIVAAVRGDRGLAVLLGDGLGGFDAPQAIPLETSRPHAVAVGDLDGNGALDAVVASSTPGDGDIRVVLGLASESTLSASIEPRDVAIADLDLDGRRDVVVANRGSDSLSVLLGTESKLLRLVENLDLPESGCNSSGLSTAGPRGVAIADWNDDDKLDLISANSRSGSISIVLQR